jgi:CRP-like cAMP-binding protein
VEWALLRVLPEPEQRSLLSTARRRRFAKGEVVFHHGDHGDSLHLVAKGKAAIRLATRLGDIYMARVIPPGGWFGELAVITAAPRNATVLALEPLETLALGRTDVNEVRRRVPAFDRMLCDSLAAEIQRQANALLEALFVPVEQRTYRRLADLVPLYAHGEASVVIPLTQEQVAQLVGTTRPTLNKVLQTASADGLLSVRRGHVEILDPEGLERRSR